MVSICYIVKSGYHITKLVIDNLIKRTCGAEFELIIYNITDNEKTNQYLEGLIKEYKKLNLMAVTLINNKSDNGIYSYKQLFDAAKGEYICVHPEKTFVQNNYIVDLCYTNYNIENSGITAIKSDIKNLELVPLPMSTSDEFKYVWKDKNNYVEGILFFKKSILEKINDIYKFNAELTAQGFHNYYLTNQSITNV